MNLWTMLNARAAEGKPIKVALIGAGKFGTMFIAQAGRTPGIHLVAIADRSPTNALRNLKLLGWDTARYAAPSIDEALLSHTTYLTEDVEKVIRHPGVEIVIECTGNAIAAVGHCLSAFGQGKAVINVTVEADALCGPALARRAKELEVIYSLAYGDQPALACELVDWARTSGFSVVAAGRGHKWLPHYRSSTPDQVWDHWGLGLTVDIARAANLNPKMFNAFLDGSKPSIESAAIANAADLYAPVAGLAYPAGGVEDIPVIMRPRAEGGVLERKGVVETVSSVNLDGTPVANDLRAGVWVCIEAEDPYVRDSLAEYKISTDPSGRYMSLHRAWHLIGLELGMSVATVGLRGEPTGSPRVFNADVVATAKRNLRSGEVLDGEGGYTVYGRLEPAEVSVKEGHLPLGLAHAVPLIRDVDADRTVCWSDVGTVYRGPAYHLRKELEAAALASYSTAAPANIR